MKRTTLIAGSALLAFCGTGWADIKTFDGSSGTSWHVDANWDTNSVPTADDRAVIPAGKTCDITSANAIADTIVVEATGWLRIAGGRTLTLENDDDNNEPTDDSDIYGLVELLTDNAVPPTSGGTLAFTMETHQLLGEGAIRGRSSTLCKITIEAGVMVRNLLAEEGGGIRGGMTIEGLTGAMNGKFINEGLVEPDSKGSIILASTTILDDIEGAMWSIGHCQSSMVFNRQTLDLLGDFRGVEQTGGGGTFMFNESIKTCGTYTRNCSSIDVGSGKTFSYVGFVDGFGSCGNPGSSQGDPATCLYPYVVSVDDPSGVTCEDP